jgi:hypothetical protein
MACLAFTVVAVHLPSLSLMMMKEMLQPRKKATIENQCQNHQKHCTFPVLFRAPPPTQHSGSSPFFTNNSSSQLARRGAAAAAAAAAAALATVWLGCCWAAGRACVRIVCAGLVFRGVNGAQAVG